MTKKIITISREYGSGGREIGKRVADELGIKFYDKAILSKIAEETGFTEQFIESHGEIAPGKTGFIYALVARASNGVSLDDLVYRAQHNVIQDLAEEGPCVIVGRCADYVLKDRDDVLNVFITGSSDMKTQRIMGIEGVDEKEAALKCKDTDKKRAVHYQYYTDRKWGDIKNYDLVLNSSTLGYDKCVRFILDALKLI